MANKVLNLTFASSLTNLCEVNSSFDSGVLQIAYVGKNRNQSSISRAVFERAIPSMSNVPVVANYSIAENTIGGHDMGIVKSDSGDIRLVNFTEPLGVVPESHRVWFDDVEEDDGTVHTYMFTDVLLWKRQPAYFKIKSDGLTKHSMEITVKDGHKEDGVYVIDDMEFTAFCLLGDDVEPCFESSSLEVFSNNFKKQMSEMMQDLKDSFSIDTSNDVEDKHPQKYSMEGGEKVLDKNELIAEYGIDVESLDFSIDDLTYEELKEKFEAMKAEQAAAGDENGTGGEPEAEETFALTGQHIEEIRRQLMTETIEMSWGTEPRYWYIDCDIAAGEVYAWDQKDWLMYGFTYSVDGDAVSIDFDSKKRKKYAIVDFEGEQDSPIAGIFARVEQAIKDNAEWEAKYNTASCTIASMETELEALRNYKLDIEKGKADEARAALFANFVDLEGIEAFDELKGNCSDMELDVLEEKCYALRGRYGTHAKFSAETQKFPKQKVVKTTDFSKDPYGGIVEEYLGKRQ